MSDFGLALLVESEPTIKSATRGGSTRRMASELLAPPSGVFKRTIASDVWAFGCVCGEVCSSFLAFNREPDLGLFDQRFGLRANPHFNDMEIIVAFKFSDPPNSTAMLPYQAQPSDGEGVLMPDRLWELSQWCWNHNPAERPAVETIVDMVAEIRHEQRLKAEASLEQEHNISPIASTSGTRHIFCDFLSPVDSARDGQSSSSVSDDAANIIPLATGRRVVHFEEKAAEQFGPKPGKAKQRMLPGKTVVRFGPLAQGPEPDYKTLFLEAFRISCKLVDRQALSQPQWIKPYDTQYIDLHFQSAMEANNFAMTWMMHHVKLDPKYTAVLVGGD